MFASLHIHYLRVLVLIPYLQCYIFIIFHLSQTSDKNYITSLKYCFVPYFICLRFLGRTILFCFNIIFFHISFVSDIWEPYYFTLTTCFSIFDLSQIPRKNHIILPWHYLFPYFICLRYLRTTLLYLNNMFFHISFVSDIWEPHYFILTTCFSIFDLSQIPGKNHIILP